VYFLYLKSNGEISPPIKKGEPEAAAINKELSCSLGSGIKWNNVDLFYASDNEFPEDFSETALLGKYYIENNEVKENLSWKPEEESEWL
jgi:hypothetical protein